MIALYFPVLLIALTICQQSESVQLKQCPDKSRPVIAGSGEALRCQGGGACPPSAYCYAGGSRAYRLDICCRWSPTPNDNFEASGQNRRYDQPYVTPSYQPVMPYSRASQFLGYQPYFRERPTSKPPANSYPIRPILNDVPRPDVKVGSLERVPRQQQGLQYQYQYQPQLPAVYPYTPKSVVPPMYLTMNPYYQQVVPYTPPGYNNGNLPKYLDPYGTGNQYPAPPNYVTPFVTYGNPAYSVQPILVQNYIATSQTMLLTSVTQPIRVPLENPAVTDNPSPVKNPVINVTPIPQKVESSQQLVEKVADIAPEKTREKQVMSIVLIEPDRSQEKFWNFTAFPSVPEPPDPIAEPFLDMMGPNGSLSNAMNWTAIVAEVMGDLSFVMAEPNGTAVNSSVARQMETIVNVSAPTATTATTTVPATTPVPVPQTTARQTPRPTQAPQASNRACTKDNNHRLFISLVSVIVLYV